MMCAICGHGEFRDEVRAETFQVESRLVLVEGIPAQVCCHCGEATFSAAVTEAVRRLVSEGTQPVRTVAAEVFEYHAA